MGPVGVAMSTSEEARATRTSTEMLDWRFEVLKTPRFSVLKQRLEDGCDTVCVDLECEYSRNKLLRAFSRRQKWKILVSGPVPSGALHWADYERLDWSRILRGELRGSAFCVRKGLSRKAQFYLHARKFGAKREAALLNRRLPQTMVLDLWEAFEDKFELLGQAFSVRLPLKRRLDFALSEALDAISAAKKDDEDALWIVKPSVTNKGAEILIFKTYEELFEHVHEWRDQREWVLQRYLKNPLLFQGRKFHLRVYVLAKGSLEVFFFNRVLLLAAAVDYDVDQYKDELAHITNTALQEQDSSFDERKCVFLLDHLREDLISSGMATEDVDEGMSKLWGELYQLTGEIFEAVNGEVSVFSPLPQCFELYGLDFLVTEKLEAIPLEANPGPDFRATGALLSRVIDELFENVVEVAAEKAGNMDGVEDLTPESSGTRVRPPFTRVLKVQNSRVASEVSIRLT